MPKKKKGEEEIPKELPPEEGELPEAPNLTPPKAPAPDVEAQCTQIQAVVDKAIESLRAGSDFGDVIKSLTDTLTEMAGTAGTELGGLGTPPAPPAPAPPAGV